MKAKKFCVLRTMNKSISTKAQLTMFIILGIVIISIFGFVFFTTGQIQNLQAQQQAEKIVNDILQTTSLKYYVTLCTERALEKGVDMIARQGGKVFPGQNASMMTSPEKNYMITENKTTYFVAYGILKSPIDTPQYPCTSAYMNFDIGPAFCAYRSDNTKFNYIEFGIENLPFLCKDKASGCTISDGWSSRSSLQVQLEAVVSNEVKDCVDFNSIIEVNKTYNITEGNVSTNITFSDTSIIATVNFPMVFTPVQGQPIIKIVSFQSSIATKFKQLYSIARELIERNVEADKGAVNFIINQTNFQNILNNRYGTNKPPFVFEKKENITSFDDLIKISDTAPLSDSGTVVEFLLENRPPVLNYPSKNGPFSDSCGEYDWIQMQDTYLELPDITPVAFDTDGNEMNFSYSGWLENYNETNSFTGWQDNGCPRITQTLLPFSDKSQSRLTKSPSGKIGVQITRYDIGPHNLTVTVCDKQYCDNETIRILIDDYAQIAINSTNPYGGPLFSIEDPYNLSVSLTDIYRPGNYPFSWRIEDVSTGASYDIPAGLQQLNLPMNSYDILNIKNQYNTPFAFTVGHQYRVIGTVNQGGMLISNYTIETLQKCIPFSNGKASYPYTTDNPFFADHSCCYWHGSVPDINDSTATCYRNTTYGSIFSFNLDRYITDYDKLPAANKISSSSGKTIKINFNSVPEDQDDPIVWLRSEAENNRTYGNSNDIISRSFERKCDGTRGNVCVGDFTETFKVAIPCQDKNANEVATCFGPPTLSPDLLSPNSETTESDLQCVPYPGSTFEQKIGIRTDNICSLVSKCVSDENSDTGFTSNPANSIAHYICNATCGFNGCTRTTPDLCHNCYEDQTCIAKDMNGNTLQPTYDATPEQKLTISFTNFTGCNNLNSGGSCALSSISKTDFCDATNKYILHDFSCVPDNVKIASNNPYLERTIHCDELNVKNAQATDNDCTDYDRSSCADSVCTTQTLTAHNNYQLYNDTKKQYVYMKYVPTRVWSSSNLDSCVPAEVDYDSSKTLCEAASFSGYQGKWVSGSCCGNDCDEVWNSTTNTCDHNPANCP